MKKKLVVWQKGIRSVVALEDPVGKVKSTMEMDQDLVVKQVTCPIGVIGAIFESRPDAVPQISSLCLKIWQCSYFKRRKQRLRILIK